VFAEFLLEILGGAVDVFGDIGSSGGGEVLGRLVHQVEGFGHVAFGPFAFTLRVPFAFFHSPVEFTDFAFDSLGFLAVSVFEEFLALALELLDTLDDFAVFAVAFLVFVAFFFVFPVLELFDFAPEMFGLALDFFGFFVFALLTEIADVFFKFTEFAVEPFQFAGLFLFFMLGFLVVAFEFPESSFEVFDFVAHSFDVLVPSVPFGLFDFSFELLDSFADLAAFAFAILGPLRRGDCGRQDNENRAEKHRRQ